MDTAVPSRDFNPTFIRMLPVMTISYLILYKCISPAIMRRMTSCYTSLEKDVQCEWDERVLSSLSSVITFLLGVYVLLYGEGMSSSDLWTENFEASLSLTLVIAYMLADTAILFWGLNATLTDRIVFGLHHLVAMSGGIIMPAYGVLLYLAMIRMLAEGSTPFVNLRWFLEKAGFPRNNYFVMLNGIAMFLVFLLLRIVPMPFFWCMIYEVCIIGSHEDVPYFKVILMACAVWDIFNCYWFYKIAKGLFQAILSLTKKRDKTGKEE